jgi:hypothetical protein
MLQTTQQLQARSQQGLMQQPFPFSLPFSALPPQGMVQAVGPPANMAYGLKDATYCSAPEDFSPTESNVFRISVSS